MTEGRAQMLALAGVLLLLGALGHLEMSQGQVRTRMQRQVRAQLRSDSGRSSKVIRHPEGIEAVVEVPGAGELVLRVDRGGGYSLRRYPEGEEGSEAQSRDLLAVGVVRADGIVAVRPEGRPTSTPPSTS